MLTNEAKRQRLITIRNEMRSLMQAISLPRNKSVACSVSSSCRSWSANCRAPAA